MTPVPASMLCAAISSSPYRACLTGMNTALQLTVWRSRQSRRYELAMMTCAPAAITQLSPHPQKTPTHPGD